jgi:hypothetical protein
MSSKNEVYHRTCLGWTVVIDGNHCARCGDVIPSSILMQASSAKTRPTDELRERTRALAEKLDALRAPAKSEPRA